MSFYLRPTALGIPLLTLLAMGNWGNTPTPPNDPDAPGAVGNEGELILEIDGETATFRVQSARFSSGELTVEGERVKGQAQFVLTLDLPESVYQGDVLDPRALRQAKLTVRPSSRLLDPAGQELPVFGGRVRVTQASGSGPWEVDGEVELATTLGAISGTLQIRVRA